MTGIFHVPVMINEALASLNCKKGGVYFDGTVGGGGHAYEILVRTAPDGMLIGVDRDEEALQEAERRLKVFGERKILMKGNFADLGKIVRELNLKSLDGILLDLGVSAHQLEEAGRGFSLHRDAPIDMRMDKSQDFTGYDLINSFTEKQLEKTFREYGEERMAGRIARAIVKRRREAPIATTVDLADLIGKVVRRSYDRQAIHPATRTFQAIRIAVNDELGNLRTAIAEGVHLLAISGRFVIISFHSLEDRIVKKEFRHWAGDCTCPTDIPFCVCKTQALLKVLTKRPIRPGKTELEANPRARSARLRTAERI